MNAHFEYSVHGPQNGNWVTLSHPIGSSMEVWSGQIKALSKHFRVLAYNLRGHGNDARAETRCNVEDLAGDVLQLWQQLGITRSHFVGLSLGGCIGVALAHKASEKVQSLVVANSRLEMDEPTSEMWRQRASTVAAHGMQAVVAMTLERWFTPEFLPLHGLTIENTRQTLLATSANGFCAAAQALADMHLQSVLPGLQTPTLFISGLSDKAIASAMVEAYAMQNSIFEFKAMAGPHIVNLENAAEFDASVLDFISRHDA